MGGKNAGNKVLKVLLGIVIVAGICVGIFFALPASVKYNLVQFYQETFKKDEAKVMHETQKLMVPGTQVTFKRMLEANFKSTNWHVETLAEGSSYVVKGGGYKGDISYPKEDGTNNYHHTNCSVMYIFTVDINADGSQKVRNWSLEIDGILVSEYEKTTSAKTLAAKTN